MKVINNYELQSGYTTLNLTLVFNPLKVIVKNNKPYLYVEEDLNCPRMERTFVVHHTGEKYDDAHLWYVDSYYCDDFCGHVFSICISLNTKKVTK